MAEKPTYLLIDSQVLPDVFLKVVRAKEMLARGKVKSAAMAARAWAQSAASATSYPAPVSRLATIRRSSGSSSTSKIRCLISITCP